MGIFKRESNIISYTIDKTFANNFSISICDGQVAVSVPWYASRKQINQVIEDKKNWIMQKLEEYENRNKQIKSDLEKKTVCVWGEKYGIKISYKLISYPELNLDNNTIQINLPVKYRNVDNTKILELILEKFYTRMTEKEVEYLMEKYRNLTGLAPEDYRIEKMLDCFGKFIEESKEIIINSQISKYSKKIIEYVVLHEICHLKYKTHGKYFTKMIAEYLPEYVSIEKEIKGLF